MADSNGDSTGSGPFGFLTHKIGPFPVWLYAAAAIGVYYWYTHYGPGASSASSASGQKSAAGTANVDQITVQPSVSGSQYKTNAEWEDAALNYLVAESVPPDEASAALFNYLHSKALNTQEQKDVNLAIEGIGPPPKIPAPSEVPIPVDGGPHGGKPPGPKPKRPIPIPVDGGPHGGRPPGPRPRPHHHPIPLPRHGRPPIGGGGPPVAGGPPPKRKVPVPPRREKFRG